MFHDVSIRNFLDGQISSNFKLIHFERYGLWTSKMLQVNRFFGCFSVLQELDVFVENARRFVAFNLDAGRIPGSWPPSINTTTPEISSGANG